MGIILVVVAWAAVAAVLAIAAAFRPARKDRPSIFAGLTDIPL